MGITLDGIKGEKKFISYLIKKNKWNFKDYFIPDAISLKDGIYQMYEIKNQERFTKVNPYNGQETAPYEGHGLPPHQVKARLRFQKKTKIRCVLVIFEKGTNNVFYQFLDVLEKGEHFDTKGLKIRRIYKLGNFFHDIYDHPLFQHTFKNK